MQTLHEPGTGGDDAGLGTGRFHPPFGGVAGVRGGVLEFQDPRADGVLGGFRFASQAGEQAVVVGERGFGGNEVGGDRVTLVEQLVDHQDGIGRLIVEARPAGVLGARAFECFAGLGDEGDVLDRPGGGEDHLFEIAAAVVEFLGGDSLGKAGGGTGRFEAGEGVACFLQPLFEALAGILGFFRGGGFGGLLGGGGLFDGIDLTVGGVRNACRKNANEGDQAESAAFQRGKFHGRGNGSGLRTGLRGIQPARASRNRVLSPRWWGNPGFTLGMSAQEVSRQASRLGGDEQPDRA